MMLLIEVFNVEQFNWISISQFDSIYNIVMPIFKKEERKKEPLWWGELSIDQVKERERPDGNVVQRKKIIKASRRAKKKG